MKYELDLMNNVQFTMYKLSFRWAFLELLTFISKDGPRILRILPRQIATQI
ncbi:MAG: hypothetical protein FMNOHCHN_00435 [Ignavibacteriaceae bacterium]|nr:hypothetical protein [Ignavibacteriaceae bacterium]